MTAHAPLDVRRAHAHPGRGRADIATLAAVALLFGLAHMLTNGQYGFHRDEWQFLSDARDMDWGFVPYPPLTAALEHLGLGWFGLSLVGLRMFSVIAQSLVIFASGMMTRDLGGGRVAQVFVALAVGLSPVPLFQATEFQYSSFDLLWWVLLAWCVVRLLRDEQPRWWLAIGVIAGLGLQTKYSIAFYLVAVLAGALLTSPMRHLRSGWFWLGGVVALAIVTPNLIWLWRHDFVSYHFLQGIHARDIKLGRTDGFLRDQLLLGANLAALPVWIAGLIASFRSRRYRMLGWMFVLPVALFAVAKGRFYYTSGAFPMMLAMGAVASERWLRTLGTAWRNGVASAAFVGVLAVGAYATACLVPIATSGPWRDFALAHSGDLREEIGWNELVAQVAAIRDALPPEQQADLGIGVGNYGEYGAVALMGPRYHLPMPITTVNTGWLRGYPHPPPSTLIMLGNSREDLERMFRDCRLAGHVSNPWGVVNEESRYHPDIFVCREARGSWDVLWARGPEFG